MSCVLTQYQAWAFLSFYSLEDPREIVKKNWPPCAVWQMLKLVEETPTHHRHYFRAQDLYSLYSTDNVFRWISSQMSHKKIYPPQTLSYFLVRPEEIPLFLIYLDTMIRMRYFDVIDFNSKKNYVIVAFYFPFKNRELGLSFSQDPLTHGLKVQKAPYLKIIFRSNYRLATLYPVFLE